MTAPADTPHGALLSLKDALQARHRGLVVHSVHRAPGDPGQLGEPADYLFAVASPSRAHRIVWDTTHSCFLWSSGPRVGRSPGTLKDLDAAADQIAALLLGPDPAPAPSSD